MVQNVLKQPIRLQYSLNFSISGKNQLISKIFLHGYIHEGKVASATMFFDLAQPVVSFFQSNCRILDHQYLCKESIGIVDFLQGDNYQGTVALQNTTFGRVLPVVSLVKSGWRILSSYLRNKWNLYLIFLLEDNC